jgi:hypothetical protein
MDLKVKVIKLNLKKVEEEGSSQFGPSKDWPGGEQTRAAAAPTLRNSKTETFAVGQAHGCIKRLLHVREARPRFCHAGSENGIVVEIARVRHMDCRGGHVSCIEQSQQTNCTVIRGPSPYVCSGFTFVVAIVVVVVVPVVFVVSVDALPRSSLPDCVFGCGHSAQTQERDFVSVDFEMYYYQCRIYYPTDLL